ncbi:hypothetical protein ABDK00_013870 [Niabella insulamsoli]|uniref:hypothetical protein n=1 Tax=Niabella insulamsoli TaxID=3144874 RepID=UPI0031FBCCE4
MQQTFYYEVILEQQTSHVDFMYSFYGLVRFCLFYALALADDDYALYDDIFCEGDGYYLSLQ